MSLVFVYSIPRETATGIHDWVSGVSGVKLKKTKVGRCTDGLKAMYNPKVGGLANYISYTPWIENGVQVEDEAGNKLMLQDKLEKKWGKPKGFFTNRPFMKGDSLKDEDQTYFQRMVWRLNDGCTVFDLNTMDGEMGYYMCLGSSRVANSEKEWRMHIWPKAEWYIALENESDQIKHQKTAQKIKALAALDNSELTPSYKRKFITLLGIANTRSNLSNEQVDNSLFEYIDKTGFTPGSNIDKFNEIYNLFKTPSGREEIEARWILNQAIDARVIYEKAGTYTWTRPQGSLVIGERLSEAVDFILNPKKALEVEELQDMIKAKF